MEILSELPLLNNSVVGLGFFDGVHIGHKAIINKVNELGKANSVPSVIITFQASPAEQFINNVKYITTNSEKRDIISSCGIDYLIELPFNEELMNTSAQAFINKYLKERLNASVIVTGFNYTFGKDRLGTVNTLESLKNEFQYKYIKIEPIKDQDIIISSTYIKNLLSKGDIEYANSLLTTPFQISGKVIEGNKIGRKIGFPTANILYNSKKTEIPFGVYSAITEYENQYYQSIMNYGIKPTINNSAKVPTAEIHLLNFDKNIYNKIINVSIIKKIRDEIKFNSIDELKFQIMKDLELC